MIKNKIMTALLSKSSLDKYGELTDREVEVMQGVWEGFSNKEMGELFKLSIKTIEAHRNNIMNKYNTSNVMQMIRIALAKGIIKVKE